MWIIVTNILRTNVWIWYTVMYFRAWWILWSFFRCYSPLQLELKKLKRKSNQCQWLASMKNLWVLIATLERNNSHDVLESSISVLVKNVVWRPVVIKVWVFVKTYYLLCCSFWCEQSRIKFFRFFVLWWFLSMHFNFFPFYNGKVS